VLLTAAAVTTSPSQSHATVTQSLTTSAANDGRSLPVYSLRPQLTTSSVEIPEQERRLEAWLSLGSYEDVLDSNFHYWEIKKQLGDNGMEMTRIWRLHTPELRQRFDHEIETVQKSRPQGLTDLTPLTPLLPYGYSYAKASCARLGLAVMCNF